jgi:hypothetical protein
MGNVWAKPFVGGVKGSRPLSEAEATNLLRTVRILFCFPTPEN